MLAVYKRELRAYMNNVYGWLFMAIFLLFTGYMMFQNNLYDGMPEFELTLSASQYALLLLIPILCMRSMAEDRHNKTDMFYLSLPMKTSSVVLGKYFAMLTVYAIPCVILCVYPPVLGAFGPVNYLVAYLSILLYLILGAALIAVCQFLSSLTDNLVIAAVLGVLAVAVLLFAPFLSYVIPLTAIASFIGFVVLALLLAVMDFIPIIGAGTAMLPWAVISFFTHDVRSAVELLVVWGIILITAVFLLRKVRKGHSLKKSVKAVPQKEEKSNN